MLEFKSGPRPLGAVIQPASSGGKRGGGGGNRRGVNPIKAAAKAKSKDPAFVAKMAALHQAQAEMDEKNRIADERHREENKIEREEKRIARGGGHIVHTNRASDYAPVQYSTLDPRVQAVIIVGHVTAATPHITDPETGAAAAAGVSVREYKPLGNGSPIRLVSRREQGEVFTSWYYSAEHTIHGNYQYHPVAEVPMFLFFL